MNITIMWFYKWKWSVIWEKLTEIPFELWVLFIYDFSEAETCHPPRRPPLIRSIVVWASAKSWKKLVLSKLSTQKHNDNFNSRSLGFYLGRFWIKFYIIECSKILKHNEFFTCSNILRLSRLIYCFIKIHSISYIWFNSVETISLNKICRPEIKSLNIYQLKRHELCWTPLP